jgi:hypothetical protein
MLFSSGPPIPSTSRRQQLEKCDSATTLTCVNCGRPVQRRLELPSLAGWGLSAGVTCV